MYRLVSNGGKRTIYILNDKDKCTIIGTYIKQLTDLKVLACDSGVLEEFDRSFESSHVRKNYLLRVKRIYYKYFLIHFILYVFIGISWNIKSLCTINIRKQTFIMSHKSSHSR